MLHIVYNSYKEFVAELLNFVSDIVLKLFRLVLHNARCSH
jgi:hypothetical protein